MRSREVETAQTRVDALSTAVAERTEAIASNKQTLFDLVESEKAAEAAYPPLKAQLAGVKAEIDTEALKVAELDKENARLTAEFEDRSAVLAELKAVYEEQYAGVRETRLKLEEARTELAGLSDIEGDAKREIEENEALIASLNTEIEALTTAAPALLARQTAVREELEDAFNGVDRFESGAMAAALAAMGDAAAADGGGGVGSSLDARILLSSSKLENAAAEADGRVQALSKFSESVVEAFDTAATQREEAQRSFEQLAAEQRKESEAMKLQLNMALQSMASMQSQWDEAIAANAAELKAIKSDAAGAAEKQSAAMGSLTGMKTEMLARSAAINSLADEKRSLAGAEAALRKRYELLRSQRQSKEEAKGGGAFPTKLEDLEEMAPAIEEMAEAAGANAEKAAAALLRLFAKKEGEEGKADGKA